MAITLLVDANLDGHAAILAGHLGNETWREFRDHLNVKFVLLEDIGLDRTVKDDIVWRLCQERGYYLLTSNRNMKGRDSLEATIRREGSEQSLPIFTFADPDRLYESSAYVDEVLDTLLTYLLNEENFRGTGRLYLP